MGHPLEFKTNVVIIGLFFILVQVSCNNDNNGSLGSDISQACAGQFAGFSVAAIQRGSFCLCEGEFRGEFELALGPVSPGDNLIINIGATFFGAEEIDVFNFSLFNVESDPQTSPGLVIVGDPVGELQNIMSGASSLEFVIQLGNNPQEKVVCPACYTGPRPIGCDSEREVDKPKCLDPETLVDTGSSCPADSIVRVCNPFICNGTLFNEETGASLNLGGISLPFSNGSAVALGCDTIDDTVAFPMPPAGTFTYTDIQEIPPTGSVTGPIPNDGKGQGSFSCFLVLP